ncbi:Aldo/keto reductase [Apiospora rasikravindrae]|uniref:Aldo/keto reductase n=1 Tax=Apiospora rasikravindrae TaxID=990691 RepID=A0ABR1TEJ7_9PEZI
MGSIVNEHGLKNGIKASHYSQDRPVFESKKVPGALAQSIAATKVEYRRVGSSGLIVSNPILGTLGLGDSQWMNWAMDEEEARKILYAAYTRGINTWDTANAYSNGKTEAIIGRVIRDFKIPRRKLVLMTKVGRIVADTEHGESSDFVAFLDESVQKSKDYVNQYGLSRMAILSAVEQSLERLQSTYIDVLHIHRWDPDTPIEETMSTLHSLVASGKVRYLAASSMWAFELAQLQCVAEIRGWTKIVAMQHHYNLLYREEEREMIKFCQRTGVGMLSVMVPASRRLLGTPLEMADRTARSARFGHGSSDADREIIARVQQVASHHNAVMSQVALAWLNKRVSAAIVGANSIKRMDEVLGAREVVLTDEEDAWLEEPYMPKAIQGHS